MGNNYRIIPTCCNACGGQTGVLAHVIDGKVMKLEPNSENPIGVANTYKDFVKEKKRGGRMCPKGLLAVKQLYDPDRLLSPMRRKGENGWEKIGWEDALDLAAEKLQGIKDNYGPESLLWFSEDHSFVHIQQDFCQAFGTPNYMNHSNLCDAARKAGFRLTLGDERPIADLANARFILLFGWNPLAAVKWAYLPSALMTALEKGAKLVVVDPVFTATAAKAEEWLPLRPGTDGALALALGHVIVKEELYDRGFVSDWTVGFSEYASRVIRYTPEWAEGITGIEADAIRRVARELARTKPAVIDTWSGVSHYSAGTEATRAIAMLAGLTGQVDGRGNLMLPERVQPKRRQPPKEWPVIKAPRVDGLGTKYPFAHKSGIYVEARDAMITGQPYQPRGAVFVYQNFVMSVPDMARSIEALEKLDFVMAVDPYLSETAALADLVIPGTHFLERYDLTANWVNFASISLRQPVVQPLHGGPTEYDFILALARWLGLPGFEVSYEEYLDAELRSGAGISLEELRELPGAVWNRGPTRYKRYQDNGFKTPSGKFEFYSQTMSHRGFDPLPGWKEHGDSAHQDYPLALINWKCIEHTHTRSQNNPWLMEMRGSNPLWMHPVTAEKLGLKDGEMVKIESQTGTGQAILRITPEICPEAVGMTYGFGHKAFGSVAAGKGTSLNIFYQGKADVLSGQAVVKEARVRVSRAGVGQSDQD